MSGIKPGIPPNFPNTEGHFMPVGRDGSGAETWALWLEKQGMWRMTWKAWDN
jgi:hypothetical protein